LLLLFRQIYSSLTYKDSDDDGRDDKADGDGDGAFDQEVLICLLNGSRIPLKSILIKYLKSVLV